MSFAEAITTKLARIAASLRDGLKNHVSPVRFWPSAQTKSLGNSATRVGTTPVVTMRLTNEMARAMGIGVEWARSPDPLIHSWRWLQPEAAFARALHNEVQAMVRDFKADLRRQFKSFV